MVLHFSAGNKAVEMRLSLTHIISLFLLLICGQALVVSVKSVYTKNNPSLQQINYFSLSLSLFLPLADRPTTESMRSTAQWISASWTAAVGSTTWRPLPTTNVDYRRLGLSGKRKFSDSNQRGKILFHVLVLYTCTHTYTHIYIYMTCICIPIFVHIHACIIFYSQQSICWISHLKYTCINFESPKSIRKHSNWVGLQLK